MAPVWSRREVGAFGLNLWFLFRRVLYGRILTHLEGVPLGGKFEAHVGRATFLTAGLFQKDERT